jgi:hypothetical protein
MLDRYTCLDEPVNHRLEPFLGRTHSCFVSPNQAIRYQVASVQAETIAVTRVFRETQTGS